MHRTSKLGLIGLSSLLTGCASHYTFPAQADIDLDSNPISTPMTVRALEGRDGEVLYRSVNQYGLEFGVDCKNGEDIVFSIARPSEEKDGEIVKREFRKTLEALNGSELYVMSKPFSDVRLGDLERLSLIGKGVQAIPMDSLENRQFNYMTLQEYNDLLSKKTSHYSKKEDKIKASDQLTHEIRGLGKPLGFVGPGSVVGVVTHSESGKKGYHVMEILSEPSLGKFDSDYLETGAMPRWHTEVKYKKLN